MSQPAPRTSRRALVAIVLGCLVFAGGYHAGKHMAERDNARAAAATS